MTVSLSDSRKIADMFDLELKRLCIVGAISVDSLSERTGLDPAARNACERAGLILMNSGLVLLTTLGGHMIGDPRNPNWPPVPFYTPPTPEVLNAFLLRIGTEVS